jgi:AraC-like DNA-binding protein
MRVEEAKRLLRESQKYTIDSVHPQCGFSSRTTFFFVFRKVEGITPNQWIKINNTQKNSH